MKTIKLTEEAHNVLKKNKLPSESYSDVIMYVCGKRKRKLMDFFGILKGEGEGMIEDLEKIREMNLKLKKERYKSLYHFDI
jgi:predicted CopG family antitoxin